MSVIQNIQEKYAKLMAIIIAVALMIFVVMLAFENGGSLFKGGNSTTIGKVNGKAIDYSDFMIKSEKQEKNLAAQYAQYGGATPPGLQQQAIDQAWNQEINQILQSSELDKLGIKVGKNEMGDILYGPNAPADLKRLFTDTSTGQYNGRQAKASIDQMLKMKKGTAEQLQQREQFIDYINYLESSRLSDKYNSLLSNSVNYPKWFIEKKIADNSQLAKIEYVRGNYSENADSTIKVSDKEIEEYLDKHKKDYKQQESRSISYVAFSTLASSTDSASARDKVAALKAEFEKIDTAKKVADFLNSNGSRTPYSDIYAGKSLMQMQYKDSIQSLPINGVFGPYLDGGTYTLAKMIEVKQLPDSVKCRHVLVGTDVKQGGVEDSVASKKIDSIKNAINGGASWADMVEKYNPQSDGSRKEKGEMTFSSSQIQDINFAKEFAQFILFDGKPGDKKVVKTSFGYHYIEILSFIKTEPHYKVAYMAKPIEVSNETDNNASNMANQFRGNSKDPKTFDANAEKLLKEKGINKSGANEITPSSYSVGALGQTGARAFVKDIYKADLGEVLDPKKVGDNWVVAIVTEINEEGTLSIAKARPQIEPLLRNKKIAEKLKQKIGNITTLEAAAAVLGGKPIETIDSLRMLGAQVRAAMGIAAEPKVIGAAFDPANRGKIVPQVIEGTGAAYVVRVDNVTATSVADANVAERRKAEYQQGKQQATGRSPIQVLRESATIKDYRIKFF